ncbi:M20 aminoacylase family protein [Coralliovum pocilloporae]|uniref:M20 aminoacylase family protein n=1 Tax=Coralliovum pocilloporae TaxID=3066369 RepID=UPI003306ACD6
MPVINRLADFHADIKAWRHDIHANPELQFDVHRTAGKVASLLQSFGVDEVVTGVGRTGVVGVIRGRSSESGRVVGMRADMDALPIEEVIDHPYKSTVPGKMHACGHDGHTAMLLGAARYLAETRNFDGTAVVIFQPAEEGGAGGKAMVDDGMMDRFGIQEVYGMHNMPGLPVGEFVLRPGPIMAAVDTFYLTIEGVGGHAARPQDCLDPIVVGSQVVTALQTIVSRTTDPLDSAVISITQFHGGDADNVIPHTVELVGSVRSLTPEVRIDLEQRIRTVIDGICAAHGAKPKLIYEKGYPVTRNHDKQTDFAASVARSVAGVPNVSTDIDPVMGAEDFSYMLEARPGAFIFVGNGDSEGLHHPEYDFNDEAIPFGSSYWARLAETAMPVSS